MKYIMNHVACLQVIIVYAPAWTTMVKRSAQSSYEGRFTFRMRTKEEGWIHVDETFIITLEVTGAAQNLIGTPAFSLESF